MKALVVTCFESNEERVISVLDCLKKKDYEVSGITTDFSHARKEMRTSIPEGLRTIPTLKYKKNISLSRLSSHKQFASDAFFAVEDYKPDLLWVMAPANSLIRTARKYKKKYPNTKLIIDMIDMWPESLPTNFKDSVFLKPWKNIRTNNIKCADRLVVECDLYKDILSKEYDKDITTIHWCRENKKIDYSQNLPSDKLSLAYIGSINNIIDIDEICRLIETIDREVVLHVIGDGENKDEMIKKASGVCEVIYHGKVYDDSEKEEIFRKCHAGLNIYKENLYIGLTVKSLDYFQYQLPVINNIKGDTWNLIEKYNAGINVSKESHINSDILIELRSRQTEVFKENFTKEIFEQKCDEVID